MRKYAIEMLPFKPTEEQYKKLNELSKKYNRPKAYFIRLALDLFLKRVNELLKLEEEFEKKLYEIALERLNDKEDEILTLDEFEREIGRKK
jgi:predicted DNA-binding protein